MKTLWCTLFLTVALVAPAQTDSTTAGVPFTAVKGSFIGISVADVNASAKWYSEKLGLRTLVHFPVKDKSETIVLNGGGLLVELVQNQDAMPLSKANPALTRNNLVHGIFKSGLIVEDLDQTLKRLRARQVDIVREPSPAPELGMRFFLIRDNAGNYLQFFGK